MANDRTIDEALVRVARGTAGSNDAQTLRWHIQELERERDALEKRAEFLERVRDVLEDRLRGAQRAATHLVGKLEEERDHWRMMVWEQDRQWSQTCNDELFRAAEESPDA